MGIVWLLLERGSSFLEANRPLLVHPTIRQLSMFWTQVSFHFHFHFDNRAISNLDAYTEHIKYPEPNKPPPPEAQGTIAARRPSVSTGQSPQPSPPSQHTLPNGAAQRAMSPTSRPPDAEELRRAISPPGTRPGVGGKPMNGIPPGVVAADARGKLSMSPLREGDEFDIGSDEGDYVIPDNDVPVRERAMSPEGRSKSPTRQDPSMLARSLSPSQVQGEAYYATAVSQSPPNMASIAMQRNAQRTRTPSPIVDRTRASESSSQAGRSSPTVMNGYGPGHVRPGSTGNVTADLIRDLKIKEAEVELLRKREHWMKAALRKATNAGFSFPDGEMDLSDEAVGSDESDVKSLANMIMHLKQEHARVQVRVIYFYPTYSLSDILFVE